MEPVRCFIAVELPEEVRDEIAQLQAQLKSDNQPGVKWVNPYGIHLTLKFLGSVAQDRISQITRAMGEAAQGVAPFHLKVEGLGVFPNLRRVQVAWVGLSGEVTSTLKLLQVVAYKNFKEMRVGPLFRSRFPTQGPSSFLFAIEWEPLSDIIRNHVSGIFENLLRRLVGITILWRFYNVRYHFLPPWGMEYRLYSFRIQSRPNHLFFCRCKKGDDSRALGLLRTQNHPLPEIGHDSSKLFRSHVSLPIISLWDQVCF